MKKTENLFLVIGFFAVVVVVGGALWQYARPALDAKPVESFTANKYGAFLAAQHAVFVNDFEEAANLSGQLQDRDLPTVQNVAMLSDFLGGKMPEFADKLDKGTHASARLIYAVHLIDKGDWSAVYARHKSDTSAMSAPLRIWSGVASDKTTDVLKFIDKLPTNDSWKSFVRGQIYAQTGKPADAAKHFEKISIDFININDYMYLMAFYNHNKMESAAEKLRTEFTNRPGGMFMLDYNGLPDWSEYNGYRNALAFGMIHNVSHTQSMAYSDISIIMLRFAQLARSQENVEKSFTTDAINYYLGQYFVNTKSDYKKYFEAIDKSSPFYPFALMSIADKTGNTRALEAVVKSNPLFVPAINKLVARNIQQGSKRSALKVVNKALDNTNLTQPGKGYLLKTRAHIYLMFNGLDRAQQDINAASEILPKDAGIMAGQVRIWIKQGIMLDTAYEYALTLVKQSPSDVEAWSVLGLTVNAKEGATAALSILERVGQVATTCSSLFEQLGDLYKDVGLKKFSAEAYVRAIELSDDGLTVVPVLKKKLRKVR